MTGLPFRHAHEHQLQHPGDQREPGTVQGILEPTRQPSALEELLRRDQCQQSYQGQDRRAAPGRFHIHFASVKIHTQPISYVLVRPWRESEMPFDIAGTDEWPVTTRALRWNTG